ncbi:MAG: OmpA family protein [Flavipsychrobacter sp.]|nr:OmpA family protein [Flavipsychrobacter sp.]
MKSIVLVFLSSLLFYFYSGAQTIDPKEKVKRKTTQRADQRTEEGIDKGLDKIEEGINGLFKKKKKSEKTSEDDEEEEETSGADTTQKPVKTTASGSGSEFKRYSKFDFVPGEKIIAVEDFSQDAIGDFPARWNTNASGEVITVSESDQHWMNLTQVGYFYPEFLNKIPENSTIEFELLALGDFTPTNEAFSFGFVRDNKSLLTPEEPSAVWVSFNASSEGSVNFTVRDAEGNEIINNNIAKNPGWTSENNRKARVSVWRQKTRLRVYMNETKLIDLPRAFDPAQQYRLLFHANLYGTEGLSYAISQLRVAEGMPDTRSKLITEGKFVTNAILFDVNKAIVKPSSYGVIKEIAQVLKENAAVKVAIVGHTDSDGSASGNLTLSKQRAESVKNILVTEFGIDASRLSTDGKGSSQPIDNRNSAEAKASNRRVEFIKQ